MSDHFDRFWHSKLGKLKQWYKIIRVIPKYKHLSCFLYTAILKKCTHSLTDTEREREGEREGERERARAGERERERGGEGGRDGEFLTLGLGEKTDTRGERTEGGFIIVAWK